VATDEYKSFEIVRDVICAVIPASIVESEAA